MKDSDRKFSRQVKFGATDALVAAVERASERNCSTISETVRRYCVTGLRADGIDPAAPEAAA